MGSSFLILKIEEIKYENVIINEDEELNKMIQFETSKQLDQFSKIFYGHGETESSVEPNNGLISIFIDQIGDEPCALK